MVSKKCNLAGKNITTKVTSKHFVASWNFDDR